MRLCGWFFILISAMNLVPIYAEPVKIGLDVLLDERLELLKNKRVGIIGNHTAVDSNGISIVERIQDHAEVVALFGPEHGFSGSHSAGDKVDDSKLDGIPIYSLYGSHRTPTPEMLKNVEVLIYDIQDVGVKFYTYISNLFLCMQAAEREDIPIVVLDRPNPIDALRVEGAVTNPAYASFVGIIPLTARYGMTVGEIAKLMNGEPFLGFALNADLTVVPMKNYKRDMWYDETGVPWVAPSPNMGTLETAAVYPGLCLIEGTNLSEGRGTDTPFLTIGAPFIDAMELIEAIPDKVKEGVELDETVFVPKDIPGVASNPKHEGKRCYGLHINITDRDAFMPIPFAVAAICAVQELYPGKLEFRAFIDRLWGNEDLRSMVKAGKSYQEIMATTIDGVERFKQVREQYLMY